MEHCDGLHSLILMVSYPHVRPVRYMRAVEQGKWPVDQNDARTLQPIILSHVSSRYGPARNERQRLMTVDVASVHSRSMMDTSLYEPNRDGPDVSSSVHQFHAQHLCDRRKLHPHASRNNIFCVWFLEIRVKDWRALPPRRGISAEASRKEAHPNAHPRPQPQDPCPAPPLPDPSAIAPPMPPLALEREQGRAALASHLPV